MGTFVTPGLPPAPLPLTGLESFAIDTNKPAGANPAMASLTLAQLANSGYASAPVALTDAATIAMNCSLGSYFSVTLGATGRTLTPANPAPGQVVLLEVKQDATGSRTITTWTNVTWAAGTAPTLTITANAVDIVRLTWNATAGKWRGETVGKAYA